MKNYVGRKCMGFRFESEYDKVWWKPYMEHNVGVVGEIIKQDRNAVLIKFDRGTWFYPISLIEQHLVEDEIFGRPTVVDSGEKLDIHGSASIPEIPQLGEGVEMEVSDSGIIWGKRKVIAQMQDGYYIIKGGNIWKYARPIQEVKKYTKEELVKILGHNFEIV
jgi:hypothetical protein